MFYQGLPIFWILSLYAAISFEVEVSGEPTLNGEVYGCHYKGKYFDEGMIVTLSDPCIQCICNDKKLSCKLEMCLDYPLLQEDCHKDRNPKKCCEQVVCKNGTNIELAFQNVALINKKSIINSCEINGTIYKNGDAVPSSNSCQQCYCIHKHIQCVTQSCILPSELVLGCEPIMKGSSCCPTKYNCNKKILTETAKKLPENDDNVIGCLYNDKQYLDGDLITEESDSCEQCYCFKGEMVCAKHNCSAPLTGCKPIMKNNVCCPIRYECEKDAPQLIPKDNSISRKTNIKNHIPNSEDNIGSQIVINRQSRIDNIPQQFSPQADKTLQSGSTQGNSPFQNGRFIMPLGNFENSQENSNFQNPPNENNRQQPIAPPQNMFPSNFNNVPENQSTLTNQFQRPDSSQSINQPNSNNLAATVQQSFFVDNRPIVSLQPSSSNGMAATPFSNFDSSRNTGMRPFTVAPNQLFPPNQPMNNFSNQFSPLNNQQFNPISSNIEVDLPPNIIQNGRIIGSPEVINSFIGKSCRERGRLLLTLDPCQYLVCGGIWVQTHAFCTAIPQRCTGIRMEGFCCPIIKCSDEFSITDIPPVPSMNFSPVSDSGPGQLITPSNDATHLQFKDGDACTEQTRLDSLDPCQALLCVNRTIVSYIQPCPPALQGCSLIKDPRSCCPINLKCVSNESNPPGLLLNAMDRQNNNGQNSPIINRVDPSSFRPPPSSNSPSSFRPQKFEIGPFGMAIIPTGDRIFQNDPSFNNQFNRQPGSSDIEQFRNQPKNPNPQMPPQNAFMTRPNNDRQQNPNVENQKQIQLHDFIGSQQGFPLNRPPNEDNGFSGLISQSGFKPILGGIPSVPMTQPPENTWDKAIQMVEPGPFRKPENSQNFSSEHKPNINIQDIPEMIELDDNNTTNNIKTLSGIKDIKNNINNSNNNTNMSASNTNMSSGDTKMPTSNTIMSSRTRSTKLPTRSTNFPTRSTNFPTRSSNFPTRSSNMPTTEKPVTVRGSSNNLITDGSTSSDNRKATDNQPILIPTFPPSTGGRGCRIGGTKFEDGSMVDVGNPCISCSCMDSGLWCVPNAKCPKT